jgi:protein SCO1/2
MYYYFSIALGAKMLNGFGLRNAVGGLLWLTGLPAAVVAVGILMATPVKAQGGAMGTGGHEHHHDHAAATVSAAKRSEADYRVPAMALVRQDGQKVNFPAELDDGRPVILNFIYTSCTAICPATTQVLAQVQEKLGKERGKAHMISISIDPEYDTPARLDGFARKLGAGAQWQFYTGTLEASVAMQKAFDAYRGDKMNHMPVTYLRAAPGKPWVRLDGLRSPDDIVKEFRGLVEKG